MSLIPTATWNEPAHLVADRVHPNSVFTYIAILLLLSDNAF